MEKGSLVLFSDFEDDGPMWAGAGPREVRKTVKFSQPFLEPPMVTVSLSLWDIHHATNFRADLSADGVCESKFDVVFRTWGDTRIARMRADWMALGPVEHADNWNVD